MPNKWKGKLPSFIRWEKVYSFTETQSCHALVAYPTNIAQCQEALSFCISNGLMLCPRGSGHSYGDIALNEENLILNTQGMRRILSLDTERAQMVAEAGVRIIEAYQRALPHGMSLSASPGEGSVTIAGGIANNIHGKDSWRLGNFGEQILSLTLLLASGEIVECTREIRSELFFATIGGMGLTGIILHARIQLQRIPSPVLTSTITPASNLKELLRKLAEIRKENDFIVAWMDFHPRGASLGRGLISHGRWNEEHTEAEQADNVKKMNFLAEEGLPPKQVWKWVPALVNPLTSRLFNWANYIAHRLKYISPLKDNRELFTEYNFWGSRIPDTKDLCGDAGVLESELFVPKAHAEEGIRRIIEICHTHRCVPIMSVMKMHKADDFLVSFEGEGYGLTVEINLKGHSQQAIRTFIDALFGYLTGIGGKVYLAKDQVLTESQFKQLYPNYTSYLTVKRTYDPENRFQSDMYRRLFGLEGQYHAHS